MTLDATELPDPSGSDVAAEIDRLERQFGFLFDSYRQRIRQRSGDLDPALQPAGYRTVFTLVVDGPMGASPLADLLGFDKSVLSRQLHQLVDLGLVSKAQDPADGRAVIISATPAAIERVEAIRSVDRDEFRARLAAWDRHDLSEFARLLAKLADI